jgi:hypothetical protein
VFCRDSDKRAHDGGDEDHIGRYPEPGPKQFKDGLTRSDRGAEIPLKDVAAPDEELLDRRPVETEIGTCFRKKLGVLGIADD